MKSIVRYIHQLLDRRNARCEDERLTALKHQFDTVLQVKEFDGALYISVDGVPMVAASDIRPDATLIEVLRTSRSTATAYLMRQKGGDR